MTEKKTGIEKRFHDKIQPFAVYFHGYIIWFAKTLEEAELKLKEEKKRNGRK